MDGRAGICEDLVPCTAMLSDGNKQSKYLKLNNEGSVEIEEAKVFGVCLVAGMIQLFMIDSLSQRASRHPAAPTTARHIPLRHHPPRDAADGVPREAGHSRELAARQHSESRHVGKGSGFTSTAWVGGMVNWAGELRSKKWHRPIRTAG